MDNLDFLALASIARNLSHRGGSRRTAYTELFQGVRAFAPQHRSAVIDFVIDGFESVSNQWDFNDLDDLFLDLINVERPKADPRELLSRAWDNPSDAERMRAITDVLTTESFIKLLEMKPYWPIEGMLKVIGRCPRVVKQSVARHLITSRQTQPLAQALGHFTGLDRNVADALALDGHLEEVFENLHAFEISPQQQQELVTSCLCSEGNFEQVLGSLHVIPPPILQQLEREHFLMSFTREIGIPCAPVYAAYRDAKVKGDELTATELAARAKELADVIIGSSPQSAALARHPWYSSLVDCLLPVHSPGNAESCRDRSADISRFNFKPVYHINLSSGVTMELVPGKKLEQSVLARLESKITKAQRFFGTAGADKKKRLDLLVERLSGFKKKLSLPFNSAEEIIFAAFLQGVAGKMDMAAVQELVILYHYVMHRSIEEFMQGTREQAAKAKNQEYAYLLYLREYFADQLHDAQKAIAKKALMNPRMEGLLKHFYAEAREWSEWKRVQDALARHQADKRGQSPALLNRIQGILLSKMDSDQKKNAVAKVIESEQNAIADLIQDVSGKRPDQGSLHLSDYDRASLLDSANWPQAKEFDLELLPRFFENIFNRLFAEELAAIDRESSKFRPLESPDKKALTLEAFFTKNRTSAYARRVAGVCVAQDNPSFGRGEKNQWDLPNFFQLVLRDPRTKKCEGLVMLHHYSERGKQILTASFNPTSTYLYKVNERELFQGLLNVLIEFAGKNNIDIIACSANLQIRTNRTGGEFERALTKNIRRDRPFSLAHPQPFSFQPLYDQQDLAVLWEK